MAGTKLKRESNKSIRKGYFAQNKNKLLVFTCIGDDHYIYTNDWAVRLRVRGHDECTAIEIYRSSQK